MGTKLVKAKSYEIINLRLNSLKEKIYETIIHEDKYLYRNDLLNEVQTINLKPEDLELISAENALFYINYNTQFAMKKLNTIPYGKRTEFLNRLLKLDLTKNINLMNVSDFLQWSINYFYKDEDMAKLMQFFCKNTDYKESHLIFEVYSIYCRLPDEYKCKEIIVKKHNEILKQQKDKINSRIIL